MDLVNEKAYRGIHNTICGNDNSFLFIKKNFYEKKNIYDGVNVSIQLNGLKKKELMGEQYSFVYFKYTIENNNPKKLFFHPGKIKVNYNGLYNQSTEYDSLSSAMTEAVELPHGKNEYFLYFVFKQPDISIDIIEFEIQDTGIGTEMGEK